MKLNGRKPPRYIKNEDIVRRRKVISVKGFKKSTRTNLRREGGRRDFNVRLLTISKPASKNAVLLIAQPNPMLPISRCTMIGSITPPRLEPDTTIPNANARCLENQVPTAAIACRGQSFDLEVAQGPLPTWIEEERAPDCAAYALR